jgi:hypothetical protein
MKAWRCSNCGTYNTNRSICNKCGKYQYEKDQEKMRLMTEIAHKVNDRANAKANKVQSR